MSTKNHGFILPIILLLLMVLMSIALAVFYQPILNEKTTTDYEQHFYGLTQAETATQLAKMIVDAWETPPPPTLDCQAFPCLIPFDPARAFLKNHSIWSNHANITTNFGIQQPNTIAKPSKFILEQFWQDENDYYYRVTSLGYGYTQDDVVYTQTLLKKSYETTASQSLPSQLIAWHLLH